MFLIRKSLFFLKTSQYIDITFLLHKQSVKFDALDNFEGNVVTVGIVTNLYLIISTPAWLYNFHLRDG